MSVDAVDHPSRAAQGRIIPLTDAEIHLWLADYGLIADSRLHARYREMLDPAERVQEPRFHFERDRRRYLVTRALLRTVLSRYSRITPAEWTFSTNAYGRPAVANAEAQDLSFNISHTHSLIVLGVSRGRALGVDVENVRTRQVSMDIADRYFAPEEVAVLNAAPRHEQQYRFFEYWTFKESYIKARGMGLSLPLDKFSFHYASPNEVAIAIHPELADDPGRWQFWQFQPGPDYLVAVCAERVGAQSPRIVVRQAVPLLDEQGCSPDFLRISHGRARIARDTREES